MGIFEAVDLLPKVGQLADWDEQQLRDLRAWFIEHLPMPSRVARTRRPNAKGMALSWFKATATVHIENARELAALLNRNDLRTTMLTTERPGYVVYEDEVQVLAEPFRGEDASPGA